jgi:hypothetical protein
LPPKIKFSKEDVLKAAFELVEEDGWAMLTAKNIARKLKSSVIPIYREYDSLKEIRRDVVRKGLELFEDYRRQHHSDISIMNFIISGEFFTLEHKALSGSLSNLGPEYDDIVVEWHKDVFQMICDDPYFKDVTANRLALMYYHTLVYSRGLDEIIREGKMDGFTREGMIKFIEEAMSILMLAATEHVAIDSRWDQYNRAFLGREDMEKERSVESTE